MKKLPVKLKLLDERLKNGAIAIPEYVTEGSAAVDLRAMIDGTVVVGPKQTMMIGTGLAMAIEMGWYAELNPRSGLGARDGIVLGNLTGIIDSDYRDEIKVCIWNRSEAPFEINEGDRICQMLFKEYGKAEFEIVDDLDETDRKGGFGHSGVE